MRHTGRARDDGRMIVLATTSASLSAACVAATVVMVAAGVGKKRLRWRTTTCPVCHHERGSCTCRWL